MAKQNQANMEEMLRIAQEIKENLETLAKALEARERRIRQREKELGLSSADENAKLNRQAEQAVTSAQKVDMTAKTTSTQPDSLTVFCHINDIHKAIVQHAQLGYRLDADERVPGSDYHRKLTFVKDDTMKMKTVMFNPFRM